MEKKLISVLIVDDSALMRNLIGKIIEEADGLELAGTAMNGKFALQKIPKLKPDVIILDLEMSEMNGIEFLKARREQGIDIPVVILSSVARRGAKITMEALSLGASDFIMKPVGSVSSDIRTVGKSLEDAVRAYGLNYLKKQGVIIADKHEAIEEDTATKADTDIRRIQNLERIKRDLPVTPREKSPESKAARIDIIVFGISTGGPIALREVFSNIDADLPVPVVIVQHMPAGFTEEFAKSLDRISPLTISEARDGDVLKPGRVLIAPGNYHVEVEKKRLAPIVRLSSDEPVNGHRPSADVLFASTAKHFGNNVIAVIMTGMGRDGAREIGSICEAGGITIAQNQETCVVFGMPRVAIEYGNVQQVVPLRDIGPLISKLAKENN